MTRSLAALLLAVALPAAAQVEPPYDAPLAQRRPPDTSRTPPHLRIARREVVPCGPLASKAHETLAEVGRTGKTTLVAWDAVRAFGGSEEAARHPVLLAMALAVSTEQELPLDEATPAQREALLDVLLSPAIPQPTCLTTSATAGVRFRVLAETCSDLRYRRVEPKAWAQSSARLYMLMLHRTGEDVTEDCLAALRQELGAPDETDASPLLPVPAPKAP